jgi:hypothetical protein
MEALGVRLHGFVNAILSSTEGTRRDKCAAKRQNLETGKLLDRQALIGEVGEVETHGTTEPVSHMGLFISHFNDWQAGRVEYSPADYSQTHALQHKLGEYQKTGFLLSVDSLRSVESIALRLLEPVKSVLKQTGLDRKTLQLMESAEMFVVRFPSTPIPIPTATQIPIATLAPNAELHHSSTESIVDVQVWSPDVGVCDRFFVVLVTTSRVSSQCLIRHLKDLTQVVCVLPTNVPRAFTNSMCRSNKAKNWGCWKHVGLGKNKNLHPSMNRMSVLQASGRAGEVTKKKKKMSVKEVDSSSSDEL